MFCFPPHHTLSLFHQKRKTDVHKAFLLRFSKYDAIAKVLTRLIFANPRIRHHLLSAHNSFRFPFQTLNSSFFGRKNVKFLNVKFLFRIQMSSLNFINTKGKRVPALSSCEGSGAHFAFGFASSYDPFVHVGIQQQISLFCFQQILTNSYSPKRASNLSSASNSIPSTLSPTFSRGNLFFPPFGSTRKEPYL